MMTFGERLRELRKARGLSMVDFAKEIGTSKTVLSNIESDDSFPSFVRFAKMLKVLNVTAAEFFKGVDIY